MSRQPKSEPAPVDCRSEILPELFLGYTQENPPAAILDVGTGGPHTLDAFAFYRSKVYFLDMFSLNIPAPSSANAQQQQAFQVFSRALQPYAGTLFDICLFWELLPQLTAPALKGLSDALRPFLFSESKGYCVSQLFPDEHNRYWRYRIQDAQHLAVMPMEKHEPHQWSYSEFIQQFDCFHPVSDRLTPQGRLELLLEAD